MHRYLNLFALGAVGLLALSGQSHSATTEHHKTQHAAAEKAKEETPPKPLGQSEGWAAYSAPEKNGKICYVVGEPSKSEPSNVKRDPVHLLVTHNTAEKTTNVVSFIAGYSFKEGSDATVDVDGKSFDLFTKGDTAWTRDGGTDKALVEAMIKGKEATIKGTSSRGTQTVDTYALTGFTQAIGDIDKACDVKR